MRSLILSLVLVPASLGLVLGTPAKSDAQVFWRPPIVTNYYYPAYAYPYSAYYPGYTGYYSYTPGYSYYQYYNPGYSSYYSPGYSTYYYAPPYSSYYYTYPRYSYRYWRY